MADRGVYEERMNAWLAGEDSEGSPRDKCKNCFIELGTNAPTHEGQSRQDLGNQCYLMRRAGIASASGRATGHATAQIVRS